MGDTPWKVWERIVCRTFGGERHWEAPEECRGTGVFSPEAKYRKKLPQWMEDFMLQAERQAREDQLPLVALTERGRNRDNALIIIRFRDFIDWYVGGHNEPPEYEEESPAGEQPELF